jgi:hypothetical protein
LAPKIQTEESTVIKEAIDRLLQLAVPNQIELGDKLYVDKTMHVIAPAVPTELACSTLQGLVDLLNGSLEDAKAGPDLFIQIESPTEVSLMGRKSDEYGRRQVIATATYPKACTQFPFGSWLTTENFIIAAQSGFQRVKIQNDDGSFAKDLDYVLSVASKISAESTVSNDDDGIAQRVALKQGLVLREEKALQPRVSLAPYRTFAEIDQVVSTFIFRARVQGEAIQLALFEGDGGRWRLTAVAAIKAWLAVQITASPIIS